MSFTEAVKTCFQKYVCFEGRARRSEYWYFCLFNSLVSLAVMVTGKAIGDGVYETLSGLVSLAFLLPGLGVSVRRLHDVGKSGWYLLMSLIPIVGAVLVIVKLATDGEPGVNQYGPNPKEQPASGETAYSEPRREYTSARSYTAEPVYEDEIMRAAASKYCIYCGTKLSPGQKFCSSCGAKAE